MGKYNRPFSVDHRNPVVIDLKDPRVKDINKYNSRLGRKTLISSLPESRELGKYIPPIPEVPTFMNIYANIAPEGSAFVIGSDNSVYLLSLDYREPDYDKMHFLTKIDSTGNFVWEIRIDDLEDEEYEEFSVVEISIDASNNIYACFSISEGYPYTNQDLFYIVKIDSNGNTLWSKFIGNSNYYNYTTYQGGRFRVVQCKVDSNSNFYIAASIQQKASPGDTHQLIVKFNSSGNIVWQNIYSDTTPGGYGEYFCYGLDIDSSNNIYTISGGSATVLTKYDTSGNIIFIKQISGMGTGAAGPTDIIVDANDDIYISINRNLPTSTYPPPYQAYLNPFDCAVHLLKLDASANIIWESYIGTQNFLNSYYQSALSSVKNNSIFITMPNYMSSTDVDCVIVKMNTDGSYLSQKKITKPLNVTPSASTVQTNVLYIDQTTSNVYCSGIIKPDYETSFILKIPSSILDEYSVSFTNAVVYDDDDPLSPYSESKSFDIGIEDTSLYSPTSSSYFTLSDYTNYGTINSPFTVYSSSIIFNKTTTPDLVETKGVFA